MIQAEEFVRAAERRGLGFYCGVPCSYLQPLLNYVIGPSGLRYIGAANEGDAVATAAGVAVSGVGSVVLIQNSGLGNAVNPLTSLTWTFRIPVLIVVTLRGEPAGPADEPQHELMGQITTQMLSAMKIPWSYFPTESSQVGPGLDAALLHMREQSLPYALVARKDSIASFGMVAHRAAGASGMTSASSEPGTYTRREMLKALRSAYRTDDVIVTTTGYTSREFYDLGDASNHFYMVGSMGCASSFAFGIALAQPQRRVIVVDGDGAAIMRLGALATIGGERLPNLLHIVLDNRVHESTGGQPTASGTLDFCAIAAACGYPVATTVKTPEALAHHVRTGGNELSFLHVPIKPGIEKGLPRPTISPPVVARRLEAHLKTPCHAVNYSSHPVQ